MEARTLQSLRARLNSFAADGPRQHAQEIIDALLNGMAEPGDADTLARVLAVDIGINREDVTDAYRAALLVSGEA